MHTALIRPGGTNTILTYESFNMLSDLITKLTTKMTEMAELLVNNRIFINRLKNIGKLDYSQVRTQAITGPLARASGDFKDLRRVKPYDSYSQDCFTSNSRLSYEQNK